MEYKKPITIGLLEFQEELLPSGRKLLHFIFKRKFGTDHYKWTPPWKGDYGVERLFFKSLEIEEWNDYDGVWSKELKQVAKDIPSLDEIRLPVKVRVGEMGEEYNAEGKMEYRIAIEVLRNEVEVHERDDFLCIGNVKIAWDSLETFLLKKPIAAISRGFEGIITGEYPYQEEIGARFYIFLNKSLNKIEYQNISREVASNIRFFIRKYISDYKAIERGFEEI